MIKQDLQQIINEEILTTNIESWHGYTKENIKVYLVNPSLVNFINASNGQIQNYWIVFDEDSADKINGYQIVYDEQENLFGLAVKRSIEAEMGIMLGLYGSFIDTLNGM